MENENIIKTNQVDFEAENLKKNNIVTHHNFTGSYKNSVEALV